MGLFIDHVNQVLHNIREAPITALSTDTTTEAWKAQLAVKRAVKRVWNFKTWSFRMRRYTFTTTSGTSTYYLPRYIREVYKLLSSDSPYAVEVVREDMFDKYIPNPTDSGNPYLARLFEMAGVSTQPSSASTVSIVSSSASDTTQKVLIKGLVGGQLDYEQLSLNGTTTVTSTKSFSAIYAVTKSDATSGYITVTSNSGTVTNVILDPQEKTVRLRAIRLFPTPSSTLTITAKGFGRPPELTHAYEDTEIPSEWDYVVDQWGFAMALQAKGQDQLPEAAKQMDVGIKMLEDDMHTEEYIASEEIILPEKFGGVSQEWFPLPTGYGITYQ